jgi:hypothetical protein
MTVRRILSLEAQFLADGRITAPEATALIDAARDFLTVSSAERRELTAILSRDKDRLEPGAKNSLEQFLGIGPEVSAPPPREPLRLAAGANPGSFADDAVYFGRDGVVKGESGVVPYTRGYDATHEGPLRFAHGSAAPASAVLTAGEQARVRAQTPGVALDRAAKAYGARVDGFEKLANSSAFFDEGADFWWGKCHAWAWSALSSEVDRRVDVNGPEGQRGLWVGGEWLSRADLGNWMMAVGDTLSLKSDAQLFQSKLSAEDLVKGTAQFMMNNGGGVIADIYNDAAHDGEQQVWNQPFVSATLTASSLTGDAARGLLAKARAEGVSGGVTAKQVTILARYGAEQTDGYEGPSNQSTRTWNLYAVTDAAGKMVEAFMADDDRLEGVSGLPTRHTEELPDYFWKPKLAALDDVLAGKTNSLVEADPHGAEFKFFVGTVLTKGVSGSERAAFEAQVAALPPGPVSAAQGAQLRAAHPVVANAYSSEQWARVFGSRGLDARAFGAAWKVSAP